MGAKRENGASSLLSRRGFFFIAGTLFASSIVSTFPPFPNVDQTLTVYITDSLCTSVISLPPVYSCIVML